MDRIIPSDIPNFTLICRLCLCEDVYMFPIFNETNIYLPQRIAACVNVEVYKSDIISTLICKQCLKKVNDWHEFKTYCNDSQSKLRYWSNLCESNDPFVDYKTTHINLKEEIVNYNEEETIIPENVEDIKIEPIEISYEDFSNDDEYSDHEEESDPVSSTMYFLPDENCEIEPEPETLLVPTYELSPEAHGLNGPSKQPTTNMDGIVDLKISQVYQMISCRICEMSFATMPNRSRHEKIKHMVNFKEIKCFTCNKVWDHEKELLDHFNLVHHVPESNFIKPENKIIKNGYTYNTLEKSQEYLKEFAENLTLLRNGISSAKQISLKSFLYYNQCIQKMIDRNSIDSNQSLNDTLDFLFSQNLIIKNSCHQCCVSFKSVSDFKQHISKRYCKKRLRLVESGQIQPNQHFKCVHCDRIFGCKLLLINHIKSEHSLDEVAEKCKTCLKSFQFKYEYNSHIQETCSYQIYCSICELLFDTTNDFKMHTKAQHEIPPNLSPKQEIFNKKPRKDWKNKCCLCSKFYRFYQDLGKHFKNVHSGFDLNTCKYCGDNFVQLEELQTHINCFHFKQISNNALTYDFNNMSQIYLCVECNLVFSTNEDLERHKTIHSNEFSDFKNNLLDTPLFTCNICVQTFNFEEELNEHKNKNHNNIKQKKRLKFSCTICKKSYKTNKSLVIHNSKMHSIIKNQGTSCLKCQKTFKNVKAKNIHVKMKHGIPTKIKQTKTKLLKVKTEEEEDEEESFACIVCKKIFTSKKNLISHAKIHYRYNKMHGPNCDVCGKTCKNVEMLLDHFKTHSSKSLDDSYLAPLNTAQQQKEKEINERKCNICYRVFNTKVGLSMHSAIKHHKKTKHSCMICEDSFDVKSDLISHVQEHVKNDVKLTCEKCNESFLSDDYLLHMSKVHSTHTCIFCNKIFLSYSSLISHKGWHYR